MWDTTTVEDRKCRMITLLSLRHDDRVTRETVYTVAMGQLDRYFTPQVNIPYERHLFRTRLRDRADYCEFGEATNENIRDQVIDKCLSSRL